MTYISVPVEIEALQFTQPTLTEISEFTGCTGFSVTIKNGKYNCLLTVNGGEKLLVIEGDYLIKDKTGNITVVKPAVFEKSYIKKE